MSKTVYVDTECICHTQNPDGVYEAVEMDYFDDKCDNFIIGHRCVPSGKVWKRSDGVIFRGKMITVVPGQNYDVLAAYQAQYETMLAEMDAAYAEGVSEA